MEDGTVIERKDKIPSKQTDKQLTNKQNQNKTNKFVT